MLNNRTNPNSRLDVLSQHVSKAVTISGSLTRARFQTSLRQISAIITGKQDNQIEDDSSGIIEIERDHSSEKAFLTNGFSSQVTVFFKENLVDQMKVKYISIIRKKICYLTN